ncbi:MAG: alpha/beta hydrolase family esterase [Planctomycetota bacterium]
MTTIKMSLRVLSFLAAAFLCPVISASEPVTKEWTIEGQKRDALIFVPPDATSRPAPVVFAFHGHGGGSRGASRSFQMHTQWPEAIVVYMQGLPTPGRLTDPEGKKPGWQKSVGDQNDRDLKFFDDVLKTLRSDYKVDESRIYAMGHSNGGGFTYLLWSTRGDVFAAFGPSGAMQRQDRDTFKPKPVIHIAGENDPLVRFAWQKDQIEANKKINQCEEGRPWHGKATLYPSKVNAPMVTYITNEGHKFPASAPELIVAFFKEHRKTL